MTDKALITLQEQRRIAVLTGTMLDARSALRLCSTVPIKRDSAKYTAAQVNEKASFRAVLYHLAQTLEDLPAQPMGRPLTPIRDVLFSVVYKVYTGHSTRRFITDLRELAAFGFVGNAMSYNCISDHLRRESFGDVLQSLISLTAAPFQHIEETFAVDSTGFRIPKINEWYDEKYGWRKRRLWLKCHACVGVKSHIVAAVKVTPRNISDTETLVDLVDSTQEGFNVKEISADGAYLSIKNLEHLDAADIFPAIPFHSNSKVYTQPVDSVWRKMYHLFAMNSAFSMIKRRFTEKIFSKTETAQKNEVLCKILCHNICVLTYWLYQFGVEMSDGPTPQPIATPAIEATDNLIDRRGTMINKIFS